MSSLWIEDRDTDTSSLLGIKAYCPDSKFHGANLGPTWVLSAPDGPHVGPMNLAIRVVYHKTNMMNCSIYFRSVDIVHLWWALHLRLWDSSLRQWIYLHSESPEYSDNKHRAWWRSHEGRRHRWGEEDNINNEKDSIQIATRASDFVAFRSRVARAIRIQ